jgi:hypothetical protein
MESPPTEAYFQMHEQKRLLNRVQRREFMKVLDERAVEEEYKTEPFFDETAALLEKSRYTDSKVYWRNAANYKKEIERMKVWWRKRIEYLNREINQF